ncbi:MAG: tyrosine-type recombinase/integrase [Burkholderiales bacterium]|nr:tyrosine-type recombinase/integrase [Burkholderiales bacterium]
MVAIKKLRYLVRDVDRYGKVRYYVRRKGSPKIKIEGQFGSPDFMVAYAAALSGPAAPPPPSSASFAHLAKLYMDSSAFKALDFSTQGWRKTHLDRVCEKHGDKPYRLIDAKGVRMLRDEVKDKPSVANKRLKALRALFKWAVEEEPPLMPANPARDVPQVKVISDGHHSWEIEEVEAYEKAHPVGTQARLALAILLYTACRREDAERMGPKHVKDGRVRFVQGKNEHRAPVKIDIPLHPDLAEAIAATATGIRTFLIKSHGRPYPAGGLSKAMRVWCDAAGLPHCSAHGLRKATATRLAERGATVHEIMSITGHQSIEEVERYTKAARMRGLSDTAMARL